MNIIDKLIKRDNLLEFYKTDDIQKTLSLLLKESSRLKAGETAMRGLMMGDLWRFEFRVTKLREPITKNKQSRCINTQDTKQSLT